MKLSAETVAVLKNFAAINPSLLVRAGQTLSTVDASKRILAEAKVAEEFPREFAIYDLSRFLGILSLFDEPVLDFQDTHLIIASSGDGGTRSVKYYYTNPEFITNKADKKVKMPELALEFDLSAEDLQSILRAASVLQAPDMCIVAEKGEVGIRVCDKKNPTANSWHYSFNTESDINFCFWFTVETMKMMVGNYKVSVAQKAVAKFEGDVATYWVAMESDSTYGG
jgi:hypothetical protein